MQCNSLVARVAAYLLYGFGTCSILIPGASAQALIWQNQWTFVAPSPFFLEDLSYNGPTDPRGAEFSASGDILIGAASSNHSANRYSLLTSAGMLRWSVDLYSGIETNYPDSLSMFASADGGAFVTGGSNGPVTRIASDGSITWTRNLSAFSISRVSDQLLLARSCNSIYEIDAATGVAVWAYDSPHLSSRCSLHGIAEDGLGNTFATFTSYAADQVTELGFYLTKLDSSGHVSWEIQSSMSNHSQPAPFGVGGSIVFVTAGSEIAAFLTSSGSKIWDVSDVTPIALAGTSAEMIALSASNALQRLSSVDGAPRWSQSALASNYFATPVASVIGGDILFESTGTTNKLARVNAETGAIKWTATLPATDALSNDLVYINVGSTSDGNLVAVGMHAVEDSTVPVFLERVKFSNGMLLGGASQAPSEQGVFQRSIAEDSQHIVAATAIPGSTKSVVQVRRFNADGTEAWRVSDASTTQIKLPLAPASMVVAKDAIAVAFPADNYLSGGIWYGAFARDTGAEHWGKLLYDPGQHGIYFSDLLSDRQGNLFSSFYAQVYCSQFSNSYCGQQTVAKLSAVDGSVLWRYDNLPQTVEDGGSDPPALALVADDAIISGPFAGAYAGSSLLKLSATDGSVKWASTIPGESLTYALYPSGDGNVIAAGRVGWSKIDANSGAVIFSKTLTGPACSQYCYPYDSLTLASGGLLIVGEGDLKPSITYVPLAPDAPVKFWALEPNVSGQRSSVTRVRQDSTGRIWLELNRHWGNGIVHYLAQFDLATGAIVSQQAIHGADADTLTPDLNPVMLAAPENDILQLDTVIFDSPRTTTSGNATFHSGIVEKGNLSVRVSTDSSFVTPGQDVTFHVTASYTGDKAISGVHEIVEFPWLGHPRSMTCMVQLASNCSVDDRSDVIRVAFDAQPGAQVTVSGAIQPLSWADPARINALIFGPLDLNESDTADNFARASMGDHLFAAGFDGL